MGPKGSKPSSSAPTHLDALTQRRLEAAFKRLIVGDSPGGVRDSNETHRLLDDVIRKTPLEQSLIDADHQRSSKVPATGRPAQVTLLGLTSMATTFLKGTSSEQCLFLLRLATSTSGEQPPDDPERLTATAEDMVELVSAFVQAYLNATTGHKHERMWCDGVAPSSDTIKTLSVHLLSDLLPIKAAVGSYDLQAVENWYCRAPLAAHIIYSVIRTTLKRLDLCYTDDWNDDELLPPCLGADWTKFKSILTLPDVLLLNQQLPPSLRHQWRYLFSSRQYGESFSQLIGRIVGRGPTLVIMRNYQGETFGGFASDSWKIHSKFYGTSESFLFTLRSQMGIFRTTGYNDHYMYLNINQQTMPNGLGMGGQLEYFGLSVSNYYGRGTCTKSCTTFDSPQLSSELEFDIETLEVWGVGPEPLAEEGTRQSALDTLDPELKAILEMTGKAPISDAIREADQKDPSLRDTVT